MSSKYSEFGKYKDSSFQSFTIDQELFSFYKSIIKDEKYFNLIAAIGNGGFFFDSSLQLYSYTKDYIFNNIDYVNQFLKEEYNNIAAGLIFFGQDVFGNQFCFNEQDGKITFFNIETGDREIIAYDIDDWIGLLFDETDYFTGYKLLRVWKIENGFSFNQRLCPKLPFILGGGYTVSNMYASTFPDYIKTAANIAKQVYNLPDGTNFKIKINNNS